MIPPVCLADVSLEIVCCLGNDDVRRTDHGADGEEDDENGHDYSQALDQIKIRDFDSFCRSHSENNGDSI